MLEHVVVDEIEVVAVGEDQFSEVAPVEVARPPSRIEHVQRPLIRQRRIHRDVRHRPAVPEQRTTPCHVIAEQMIVGPPDVDGADQHLRCKSARRNKLSLRCSGKTLIVELVRTRAQEHVAGDLKFFERVPALFPMQVSIGLRADDVAPIQMRTRGGVIPGTDPRVEPGHRIFLASGDLQLRDVALSGPFEDVLAGIEYFFFLIASCIIASFISQLAFFIVFLTNVLLFIYSNRLKRIPLLGNITVAYLTGMAFIYGGVSVGHPRAALIPAVFAFLINLIRELIKDIQDIGGDKNAGIKTFPIKFGINKTKYLITFLVITLVVATFLPFVLNIYKIEFFVLVMLVVNPILIYFLKLLYKNDFAVNLNKLSNILKLDMVFGLLAIFLGI